MSQHFSKKHNIFLLVIGVFLVVVFFAAALIVSGVVEYGSSEAYTEAASLDISESKEETTPQVDKHIKAPTDGVRGLYMSSWVAGNERLRSAIVDLVASTGLNAIILDLKDVTGKVAYKSEHPGVLGFGDVTENRIPDLAGFISELHEKDIYVIGRIAVFQDKFSPYNHTDLAVQTGNGSVWKDRRGLAWFDASAREVWEYIVALSEDAYSMGVDEINLDYVRFPSDGNTRDMILPVTGDADRPSSLTRFFQYIDEELRFTRGIPVSADIFGITTTTDHDVGIGQIFEDIAPYVDAVAPMIYPSHYPKGFRGYDNPAANPYEIITIATQGAIDKLESLGITPEYSLRPWIQDFDLGATYTKELVQEQIQALYDLGIPSFLVWDPSNKYTDSAYIDFDFSQGAKPTNVIE